jgi:hypothetical protein
MSVEDAAVSLENTLALTLDKKTCFEVVFIPKRLSSRLRLRPHRANAMLSALAPPARLAPTRARVVAPRRGATRGPDARNRAPPPHRAMSNPHILKHVISLALSPRSPIHAGALRVSNMAGQKDGRGGPRNRTGRTHDPYSTPLRDANRDRLYGFLTARAAWTLLTYLVEINKAGASFLTEYMSRNPIPYHYGAEAKIADVSGENFILGLMTMTPVNIDEKYRNNYITVDPPALAVRLLDIRLALHDEFVADLAHGREENADIMKVACMSNLENAVKLDCDVVFSDENQEAPGTNEDGW